MVKLLSGRLDREVGTAVVGGGSRQTENDDWRRSQSSQQFKKMVFNAMN